MNGTLDTSGKVGPMGFSQAVGPRPFREWSDLSPFEQGYIEALLRDVRDLWRLTEMPDDGTAARVGPYWIAFRDLAPETLARIIADCEAMRSSLQIDLGTAGGRHAWEARQDGWKNWGTAPRKEWPPLTVQLGDDGKVRFEP